MTPKLGRDVLACAFHLVCGLQLITHIMSYKLSTLGPGTAFRPTSLLGFEVLGPKEKNSFGCIP